MATVADHTIEEPLNAVLRLRRDLRIERRDFGGQPCFVIEDPFRTKFYRLGVSEYALVALLDGTRTVQAAIRDAAYELRELAFSESEALSICRWLLDTQLAENVNAVAHQRLTKKAEDRPARSARLHNPLAVKLPLINPTALLDRVEPWLAWTLRTPFFLAWLACCVYALGVAAANWDDLVAGTVVLLDRNHAWLLIAAWLGLKLFHETYHAIVCRKYGGTVCEAGIFILFFTPVPYVDVTSSWRFSSKWPRIATAAAGMYIELLLAAIAILVWANSASSLTKHVALSIAAMASLGTLVVNANPLMRFDGYFILADLLGIPNLNTHGRRWLGSAVSNLLGAPVSPLGLPPRAARIVKIYAVTSMVWRAMVLLTLVVALLAVLARVHRVCVVAAALLMTAVAAQRAYASIRRLLESRPTFAPRRLCAAAAVGAVMIAGTAYWLTRPATVSAPGIVEYRPLVVVRAATAGFVRELYVRDGETVAIGQRLLALENRELAAELRMAEIEIEKSIARSRSLRQGGETAKEQAELSQQAALRKKRDELAGQLDSLVVTAPAAGQVVGRHLDAWLGRYVEMGSELMQIGDDNAKEILVAVSQDDVELFQTRRGARLCVAFPALGTPPLEAMNLSIEPRGTTRAPHEALSSRLDGPLSVAVRDDPANPDRPAGDELLDPCFKGSVALSAEQSRRLHAGQLAVVAFRTSDQSWARRTAAHVWRWFERRLADAN